MPDCRSVFANNNKVHGNIKFVDDLLHRGRLDADEPERSCTWNLSSLTSGAIVQIPGEPAPIAATPKPPFADVRPVSNTLPPTSWITPSCLL